VSLYRGRREQGDAMFTGDIMSIRASLRAIVARTHVIAGKLKPFFTFITRS
jgi:hypothetical protein